MFSRPQIPTSFRTLPGCDLEFHDVAKRRQDVTIKLCAINRAFIRKVTPVVSHSPFLRLILILEDMQGVQQMSQLSVNSVNDTRLNDIQAIREILAHHGRLSVDIQTLSDETDLHHAGLTSLATVGVMLALEERFDIEFPDSKLSRATFRSISTLAETISELTIN
jgi:acyl carrier protein